MESRALSAALSSLVIAALFLVVAPAARAAEPAASPRSAHASPILMYNSTVDPLPENQPSYGAEHFQFREFGDEITLESSALPVGAVTVTMSSWACESGNTSATDPCSTTPGATYAVPVTLDLYQVGPNETVGSPILSATQTFAIPYRPSSTPGCPTGKPDDPGGGWGAFCTDGIDDNIVFNLSSYNMVLPTKVIYGISYNTQHAGPHPTGVAGPANSLNIALSEDPTNVSVGIDPNPGTVFQSTVPFNYCDHGAAGSGTFRLDSPNVTPCWGVNAPHTMAPFWVPAVQFATITPPPGSIHVAGYWTVAADGGIFAFGQAQYYGSMGGIPLNDPVVGMSPTANGAGYWMDATDGGVFAFGDARFYGSMGGQRLNQDVVGMAPTPDGGGYWLVAADGGIFAFGDAAFYGSMGGKPLNSPIIGMAPTPDGGGYWLAAADGGIFAFGDAPFYGSMGGKTLNKPMVGTAPTGDGQGYWMVASDGGIFAFGDAPFYGSMGGKTLNKPMVGMSSTPDGGGYWTDASDGGIFAFGDAPFFGSMGGRPLDAPMVGMATYDQIT
jgi:hypothetical protein